MTEKRRIVACGGQQCSTASNFRPSKSTRPPPWGLFLIYFGGEKAQVVSGCYISAWPATYDLRSRQPSRWEDRAPLSCVPVVQTRSAVSHLHSTSRRIQRELELRVFDRFRQAWTSTVENNDIVRQCHERKGLFTALPANPITCEFVIGEVDPQKCVPHTVYTYILNFTGPIGVYQTRS